MMISKLNFHDDILFDDLFLKIRGNKSNDFFFLLPGFSIANI